MADPGKLPADRFRGDHGGELYNRLAELTFQCTGEK